jgi:hypothetical protein
MHECWEEWWPVDAPSGVPLQATTAQSRNPSSKHRHALRFLSFEPAHQRELDPTISISVRW